MDIHIQYPEKRHKGVEKWLAEDKPQIRHGNQLDYKSISASSTLRKSRFVVPLIEWTSAVNRSATADNIRGERSIELTLPLIQVLPISICIHFKWGIGFHIILV